MAIACALLVLVITTLSAFIRLSRPAPACEPWPQCQSARAPRTEAGVPLTVIADARITHRIVASAALLLIVAMLMASYASQPALRDPGRLVAALLALALFLAVLGRMGADSRAPAVVAGNLLAGFAMLALAWRLIALLGTQARRAGPPVAWTWAALLLLAAQTALGAVVSALGAGAGLADPIHQIASVAVAAVLLPLGFIAWRRGRRAGAVVIGLVLLELAGGALLGPWPPPLALALAHNVAGALLVAALASLTDVPQAP